MAQIEGRNIIEFAPSFKEIVEDGYLFVAANSISIKNVGSLPVSIEDSYYMKGSGETLQMGTGHPSELIVAKLKIKFSAGAGTKRLQVVELLANVPELAHYIRNSKKG